MTQNQKKWTVKVPAFIITNLIGTAVDTVVLWLFSDYVFHGYAGIYVFSPFISFECAVLVNYLCSCLFIWRDRVQNRSLRSLVRRYLAYNASCTGVFFLKMCFLLLIERLSGWDVIYCNLLALCVSGCVNFAMNEWVVFRKKNH